METAGKALIEIRDRKLYRAEFGTFKEYVSQKWEMHWTRAYQLCDAATVVENLKSRQLSTMPRSESQTRVLSKLEPAQQAEAWEAAVQSGDTTAKGIEKQANAMVRPIPKIQFSEAEQAKISEAESASEYVWLLNDTWKKSNKRERKAFMDKNRLTYAN
jgi:hypothetical protein